MPVISVSLDRDTYEELFKLAKKRDVDVYQLVKEALRDLARSGVSAPARLEARLDELEERVEYLEEKLLELLSSGQAPQHSQQAPPRPAPAPQAQQLQPQPQPQPQPQAQAQPQAQPQAQASARPAEEREKERAPKRGVFKEISVKWIEERAKKDPERFVEEWAERGYHAARIGDKVFVASDDVVDEVIRALNERGVKGPGALEGVEDPDLRVKSTALSAMGAIYFDATTRTWKRA